MVKSIVAGESLDKYEVTIKCKSFSQVITLADMERILQAGAPSLAEISAAQSTEELAAMTKRLQFYYAVSYASKQRDLLKDVRKRTLRRAKK